MDEQSLYEKLDLIYLNPKNAASFSSASRLYSHVRHIKGVTRKLIQKYLSTKSSYTRHRKRLSKFPRRKILSRGIDDVWEGDLINLSSLKHSNSGFGYCLILVDVLSGYCWLEPCKKPDGVSVLKAFKAILERADPRKPKLIHYDRGSEFYNKHMIDFLESENIKLYSTNNLEIKASIAERKILDVKRRIFKYLTHNQHNQTNLRRWRYVDVLQDIASGLNKAKHRIIGIAPINVTKENERAIIARRYKKEKQTKPVFKVGDFVRAVVPITAFSRGFRPTYSKHLYKILEVRPTFPPTYKIGSLDSEGDVVGNIQKIYYSQQLTRVRNPKFDEKLSDPPVVRRIV